jgi:serine protease Do
MKNNCSIYNRFLLFSLLLFVQPFALAQDNGVTNLRQTSKAFASVARAVSPSVVFIQVERKSSSVPYFKFPFDDNNLFGNELFERFFGEGFRGFQYPNAPKSQKIVGQGSGFIFSVRDKLFVDKSYILTNNHVVQNAEKIKVVLQDKREFIAKIIGADPQSDVAVLEIKGAKLPTVKFGDSSTLEVGEWVIAIGNPFGLSHTLTVGVVSAKGRTSLGINDYEDFIQTDAAINPGNSGGPLVNLDGEVVGMNTAIFSRNGGYMGIGFAIPINLANSIGEQLLNKGEVNRGHLGITVQDLSADLADSFGLEQNTGILISQVMENSPAAHAGLRQGDVIINYQNKPVTTIGGFRNLVALSPPKSQQKLTIIRDGKRLDIKVIIGKLPTDGLVALTSEKSSEELGLSVQTITTSLSQQYNVKSGQGVLVTAVKPDSVAAMAGIDPGTVILQVDRKAVNNAEEFSRALQKSSGDKSVLLLLQKNEIQRYLVLTWS